MEMVDEMRRITRKATSIPSPIPRLRPHPLIHQRTIGKVRIIAVQDAIDPPAHRSISARRTGARLHIDFDFVPRAWNDRRGIHVGPARILIWRAEALVQVVSQLC